ncbi:flagellar protein FlaG [Tamilnaduibacter salinus]|uniref:Flagellar biosynthesis protein FlaG n=1 Tax=Tamilnaduibacter salinus TaxID=1484056 RepID=A0A2A2I7L3_9GAMM|nr:flagellar protein FlaG [Tamilnaduibacter salinus]PAV27388.1 flagellar biosynthesis protein FlaG [Tamilnaduibacter salinus]PVY75497.1 flagellar protein FlaG [Tamilnaduibacter salinus]
MSDVNLNSPDLKLVQNNGPVPARANASPLTAEGQKTSAPTATSAGSTSQPVSPQSSEAAPSKAERLNQKNEKQEEALNEAVTQLNDFVQTVQRDLEFEVDRESGETVVKVIDQETDEVVRQIPDELAMRLAESLQQDEPLTLLDIKV